MNGNWYRRYAKLASNGYSAAGTSYDVSPNLADLGFLKGWLPTPVGHPSHRSFQNTAQSWDLTPWGTGVLFSRKARTARPFPLLLSSHYSVDRVRKQFEAEL